MSMNAVGARCALLALVLSAATAACTGPPGPPGPPGPAGPPGSGGGPPYVWVCTPAHYPNTASNTRADLYVYNGGTAAANLAVNILNSAGANLAGETIPGTSPAATYPGQAGSATVSVAPGSTLNVTWQTPQTFTSPPPGIDPTKISTTVRVTSRRVRKISLRGLIRESEFFRVSG
ncbi:MAG: hypothetical protein LC672_03535 [Acidobacteria bacterium]|nr:hypothetical protein [Acidobacteriota bacterium]